MVLVSVHKTREQAARKAAMLAKKTRTVTHAVLSLLGRVRHDYRPGDVVDPADVQWPRVHNRCSECLAGDQPISLEHRCPITFGRPVCEAVAAVRVLPAGPSAPVPPAVREYDFSVSLALEVRVPATSLEEARRRAVEYCRQLPSIQPVEKLRVGIPDLHCEAVDGESTAWSATSPTGDQATCLPPPSGGKKKRQPRRR